MNPGANNSQYQDILHMQSGSDYFNKSKAFRQEAESASKKIKTGEDHYVSIESCAFPAIPITSGLLRRVTLGEQNSHCRVITLALV